MDKDDKEVLIHDRAQMIRGIKKNMAFVVPRRIVFMLQKNWWEEETEMEDKEEKKNWLKG